MWDSRHFFGWGIFVFLCIFWEIIDNVCVIIWEFDFDSDRVLHRFFDFCRNGKRKRRLKRGKQERAERFSVVKRRRYASEQTGQPMPKLCEAWGERIDRRSRLKPLSTGCRDVRGDYSSGFCGVVENRAGRTELMSNEAKRIWDMCGVRERT